MNEAPEIAGTTEEEYAENGEGSVATFTADDPDGDDIAWSLDGDDAGDFTIEGGVLEFMSPPNYEMPTGGGANGTSTIYSVTVVATDDDDSPLMGEEAVTVEVTNVDEDGVVTISAASGSLAPYPGKVLTAALADADMVTAGTPEWQWSRSSSENGTYTDIMDEEGTTYTPTSGDVGDYLRASVSYDDGEDEGKSAEATSVHPVQAINSPNANPMFPDQDPEMDDVQNETASRTVVENTEAGEDVGLPVSAEDANDGDILTYTLGDDDDAFDIDPATGQIKTKAELDADATGGDSYTVTVSVTDPAADATPAASIEVTITVTGVNEAPVVTGEDELTFAEVTGTDLDDYDADDPESNTPIVWSVSGDDADQFAIDAGALTFATQPGANPDFEAPGDADGDNVYEVTVVAADSTGKRGTMDVTVTVSNEAEDGTVTLSAVQPRVGIAFTASVTDPDSPGGLSDVEWQWYRGDYSTATLPTAECADATGSDCEIKGAESASYTPKAGDVGGELTAVAMYTDGKGEDEARQDSANPVAWTPRTELLNSQIRTQKWTVIRLLKAERSLRTRWLAWTSVTVTRSLPLTRTESLTY